MTPTEWGRLQGFIGYGFLDKDGKEQFSFPKSIPMTQQYKQLGNSVTIPVIEEMALFIKQCLSTMESEFSDTEKRLYSMYGKEFLVCKKIDKQLSGILQKETLNKYFNLVYHFSSCDYFGNSDIANYLQCTSARASQVLKQLYSAECIRKVDNRKYSFS